MGGKKSCSQCPKKTTRHFRISGRGAQNFLEDLVVYFHFWSKPQSHHCSTLELIFPFVCSCSKTLSKLLSTINILFWVNFSFESYGNFMLQLAPMQVLNSSWSSNTQTLWVCVCVKTFQHVLTLPMTKMLESLVAKLLPVLSLTCTTSKEPGWRSLLVMTPIRPKLAPPVTMHRLPGGRGDGRQDRL